MGFMYVSFCVVCVIASVYARTKLNVVTVERTFMPRCPENAVCSDVFTFNRTLRGGSISLERRHIMNCHCDGEPDRCQYGPDTTVRQSRIHQKVLCEPITSLNDCAQGQTASVLHKYSDLFGGGGYFSILCICPRHLSDTLPGRSKATKSKSYDTISLEHNYDCVF